MIHSYRIIQTLLILLLWITIGIDYSTAIPPQFQQLDGWNPCGRDLGFDLSYLSVSYLSFTSGGFPDYQFLLSFCRPIHICKNFVPGELSTFNCGMSTVLIPGCETSMLCAYNGTSGLGISVLELSDYNFGIGMVRGFAVIDMDVRKNVLPICAQTADHFSFSFSIWQTNSSLKFIANVDRLKQNCTGTVMIFSPSVFAASQTHPQYEDENDDSKTTAIVLTVLFGILCLIVLIIMIVGYRHMKNELIRTSSAAQTVKNTEAYQLRPTASKDSTAIEEEENDSL